MNKNLGRYIMGKIALITAQYNHLKAIFVSLDEDVKSGKSSKKMRANRIVDRDALSRLP